MTCRRCGEREAESGDYCPECVRLRAVLAGLTRGLSGLMGPAQAHRCHYCPKRARTWDHVVPRAMKGPDAEWNLVPACHDCNHVKDDRPSDCSCTVCAGAWERWAKELTTHGTSG